MYKLISQSNYFEDDLFEVVCKNRGIKDIAFIKNPTNKHNGHYSQLARMDKAINIVSYFRGRESSEIGIVVDSDADTRWVYFSNDFISLSRKIFSSFQPTLFYSQWKAAWYHRRSYTMGFRE